MKAICRLIVVIAAFGFAAAAARAQESESVLVNDLSPKQLARQAQADAAEMAEDLQIMAALLREDVLKLYGRPHAALEAGPTSKVGKPLAEHLPGYGVVLQLEVPAPQIPAARPAAGAGPLCYPCASLKPTSIKWQASSTTNRPSAS